MLGGHFDDHHIQIRRDLQHIWHRIIHPAAGDELAAFVICQVFMQRPTDALGGAAHHLPADRRRVQGAADILHDDQTVQRDFARVFIDGDLGQLRAEGWR